MSRTRQPAAPIVVEALKLESLPDEILLRVVNLLDIKSQSRVACTARMFRDVCNDQTTNWSSVKSHHLMQKRLNAKKSQEESVRYGGGELIGETGQFQESLWMLATAASCLFSILGACSSNGVLTRISLFAAGAVSAKFCDKKTNDYRHKYFNTL